MIVVFPLIPWGFLWQRPQQLLTRLAARGHVVLYLAHDAQPPPSAPDPEGEASPDPEGEAVYLAPNVFQLPVHLGVPLDIHTTVPDDERIALFCAQLNDLLIPIPASQRMYLVNHPVWTAIVERLVQSVPGTVVYDCMDDYRNFPRVVPETVKDETRLVRMADTVLASSRTLQERHAATNPRTLYLPNAADVKQFVGAISPHDTTSHRPVIGFYGHFDDWVDLALVESLARSYASCDFVLIGVTKEDDRRRFAPFTNVSVLPPQPYARLPDHLARFDICLIPFTLNELTRAVSPVKFFEYLSAGKPIVATRLPELVPFSEICYLADSAEEFHRQVGEALTEVQRGCSPSLREARVRAARENSWDARVNELDAEICHHMGHTDAPRAELRLLMQLHDGDRSARDSGWRAEVNRLVVERDELVAEQQRAWRAEIDRIVTERDLLIQEKDESWRREVDKRDEEWRRDRNRLVSDWTTRLEIESTSSARTLEEMRDRYEGQIEELQRIHHDHLALHETALRVLRAERDGLRMRVDGPLRQRIAALGMDILGRTGSERDGN